MRKNPLITALVVLVVVSFGCTKFKTQPIPKVELRILQRQPLHVAQVIASGVSLESKPYVIVVTTAGQWFRLNDLQKFTLEVDTKLDGTYADISYTCNESCDNIVFPATELKIYLRTQKQKEEWSTEFKKAITPKPLPSPHDVDLL